MTLLYPHYHHLIIQYGSQSWYGMSFWVHHLCGKDLCFFNRCGALPAERNANIRRSRIDSETGFTQHYRTYHQHFKCKRNRAPLVIPSLCETHLIYGESPARAKGTSSPLSMLHCILRDTALVGPEHLTSDAPWCHHRESQRIENLNQKLETKNWIKNLNQQLASKPHLAHQPAYHGAWPWRFSQGSAGPWDKATANVRRLGCPDRWEWLETWKSWVGMGTWWFTMII